MDKYHEIHELHQNGMAPPQIAVCLMMDTRTIKKFLGMSEQDYLYYQQQRSIRRKKLTPYEDFIKRRLQMCPKASSQQIHLWLKEVHPDFPRVCIKSVYNFISFVRNKN
jgi:hypothetical protein